MLTRARLARQPRTQEHKGSKGQVRETEEEERVKVGERPEREPGSLHPEGGLECRLSFSLSLRYCAFSQPSIGVHSKAGTLSDDSFRERESLKNSTLVL